jgi:hypothetical protein
MQHRPPKSLGGVARPRNSAISVQRRATSCDIGATEMSRDATPVQRDATFCNVAATSAGDGKPAKRNAGQGGPAMGKTLAKPGVKVKDKILIT